MRKAQKQKVFEVIQILHQAHREIEQYVDKEEFVIAQDMLGQCQEAAVSIGMAIEKCEGESVLTVTYMEQYCEELFQIYEALNSKDACASLIYQKLEQQLKKIEDSAERDIPLRREIVFFPYNASMWDALESVYLAAKREPDCDVYCVPIPYYERNSDGSLGQMHYEGGGYPENIEITDWRRYPFEERRPDAIYIHNPYDDLNMVTCVHPRFFSSNLKKYTNELVYIPYFTLPEIEPNDQATIERMKHFCFLPGTIYADKVVLQSEKMKQIYVNEYLKAAKGNGLKGEHIDRKKLEAKFVGTGSPKLEKIKNIKKEELNIPREWLEIIERADGSYKKIILYNNSITALLQDNEKMLEKMKWAFSIFYKYREEVALLWRPHPLIEATLTSMRPKLWEEYKAIRDRYLEEGWGIYDDSSDLDRAVVLSDAYYGDASSVVQLCQEAGKPVLIQNADIMD